MLEKAVCGADTCMAVDFTNVHITAARRTDPEFKAVTDQYEYFVPDSQVLKWAVNLLGGSMEQRVYGPDFLRYVIENTDPGTRHYFLGASQDCLDKLLANIKAWRPEMNVVGFHNGYFKESEEAGIADKINACDPDFIWVGLGTPKQQEWIHRNRDRIARGVMLAVGFAFDVNAGTKKDAPKLFQKLGLTWFYRLVSEPRRLWKRYLKYNSQFLFYFSKQLMFGKH